MTKVRLKRHKKEIEKLNERTYKAGYKRRKRKKKLKPLNIVHVGKKNGKKDIKRSSIKDVGPDRKCGK